MELPFLIWKIKFKVAFVLVTLTQMTPTFELIYIIR
ncbi:unnamed protein product [Rhodiola kirilowii]